MLETECYMNEPIKIVNDIIIMIFGAMDTTKTAITTAMCYLIKNKESRDKILEEVRAHCQMRNLEESAQLNPTKDDLSKNFKFLNCVLSESLRMCPPGPITDRYTVKKDVEFDGIKYLNGTNLLFWIYGIHHD